MHPWQFVSTENVHYTWVEHSLHKITLNINHNPEQESTFIFDVYGSRFIFIRLMSVNVISHMPLQVHCVLFVVFWALKQFQPCCFTMLPQWVYYEAVIRNEMIEIIPVCFSAAAVIAILSSKQRWMLFNGNEALMLAELEAFWSIW